MGVHRVTDLEQFPVRISKDEAPSTAIFREGVKEKPFGLQLCASHGRTFAWHFRCGPINGETVTVICPEVPLCG